MTSSGNPPQPAGGGGGPQQSASSPANGQSASLGSPSSAGGGYIGARISLITTYDIRYEGILIQLNQKESTIAVQNVRSFGTEGRKEPEVPISNEIYDYIVFSGKDLKDLTVIEERPAGEVKGPVRVVSATNKTPASSSSGPSAASQTTSEGTASSSTDQPVSQQTAGANSPSRDWNYSGNGIGAGPPYQTEWGQQQYGQWDKPQQTSGAQSSPGPPPSFAPNNNSLQMPNQFQQFQQQQGGVGNEPMTGPMLMGVGSRGQQQPAGHGLGSPPMDGSMGNGFGGVGAPPVANGFGGGGGVPGGPIGMGNGGGPGPMMPMSQPFNPNSTLGSPDRNAGGFYNPNGDFNNGYHPYRGTASPPMNIGGSPDRKGSLGPPRASPRDYGGGKYGPPKGSKELLSYGKGAGGVLTGVGDQYGKGDYGGKGDDGKKGAVGKYGSSSKKGGKKGSRLQIRELFADKYQQLEQFFNDEITARGPSFLGPETLRRLSTEPGTQQIYDLFLDATNFCLIGMERCADEELWAAFTRLLRRHFLHEQDSRDYYNSPEAGTRTGYSSSGAGGGYTSNTTGAAYSSSTRGGPLMGDAGWNAFNRAAEGEVLGEGATKDPRDLPKNDQGRTARPQLTMGDFVIEKKVKQGKKKAELKAQQAQEKKEHETEEKTTKAGLKKPKPKEEAGAKPSVASGTDWICPRCTLCNPMSANSCSACGFAKEQALLLDEFPPLGAPTKK